MKRGDKKVSQQLFILGLIIFFIQIFDIAVHVLSNQVELIRILSNILIMVWIISQVFLSLSMNRVIGIGALTIYLILNIIFLFLEGMLNPYGGYRIVFFILIVMTSLLSILLMSKMHKA